MEERVSSAVVWTGSELIVWGGWRVGGEFGTRLGNGARYDPKTDRWAPMSDVGAPSSRDHPAAAWTGTEMIVWGGLAGTGAQALLANDGGRYDPARDTWAPMSTVDAPSGGIPAATVWTGRELLVWGGGRRESSAGHGKPLEDGAAYDPETDTWRPVSPASPSSAFSSDMLCVWTGSEVLIWAKTSLLDGRADAGVAYDPVHDSWRPLRGASGVRRGEQAIWTGDRVIVYGTEGAAYDPSTDNWTRISDNTGVRRRDRFQLVWTGAEMILWGGYLLGSPRNPTILFSDGARYDPVTDTWSPIPPVEFSVPGSWFATVWTGEEMLVWPAQHTTRGAVYRPYWLTVVRQTEAYDARGRPLKTAQPGEHYRVVDIEETWARVQDDRDATDTPASDTARERFGPVRVQVDDRVRLAVPFPLENLVSSSP